MCCESSLTFEQAAKDLGECAGTGEFCKKFHAIFEQIDEGMDGEPLYKYRDGREPKRSLDGY